MTRRLAHELHASVAARDWAGAAQALSGLAAQCAKAAARRELAALPFVHADVLAALASDASKARKNAARLLSATGTAADVPALSAALARERTRFVVPSLLLALGAIGGSAAHEALLAFVPPAPQAPDEEKHCAAILAAHQTALARFMPPPTVELHALRAPRAVLLRCPAGFSDALLAQLAAHGMDGRAAAGGVLLEAVRDLDALFAARCFFEALLPCGRVPLEPEAVARAARPGWEALCGADAAGAPALPYRIELRRYAGDRAAFLHAVAAALGGQNRPGGYAWELRVSCTADGQALVSVKPSAAPDARFAYRRATLPASIHPAMAAALAQAAAMRLPGRTGLRIYDPCCGSGTLLVEAAKSLDCAALCGTDVSPAAVRAARTNLAAAGLPAQLLQRDCRRFAPSAPFDLVLSNLPFGNRVGSHAGNEALYRGLAVRLPALLAPGALAVLYTMEGRLLERCLGAQPGLAVLDVVRTEAGGLCPRALFCTRRP